MFYKPRISENIKEYVNTVLLNIRMYGNIFNSSRYEEQKIKLLLKLINTFRNKAKCFENSKAISLIFCSSLVQF